MVFGRAFFPIHIMASGSRPFWHINLFPLRSSSHGSESSSIGRLGTYNTIHSQPIKQSAARSSTPRVPRTRGSGNGAPKHPPPPLPNPILPPSVATLVSASPGLLPRDPSDPLLHAVLLQAALERSRPRRRGPVGGRRSAIDGRGSRPAAGFSLFQVAPQEEQFLPQGVQRDGRSAEAGGEDGT